VRGSRREGRSRRLSWPTLLGALALCLGAAGTAWATHIAADSPEGHTTLQEILTGGDPGTGYQTLHTQDVSANYIVRDPMNLAQAGRENRRRSLAYFSQLTDFQLADEESPARVEFADPGASAAWRPQEAFHPFVIDASIRQINRFVPHSPVPQGNGVGNSMDFALATGDQADNMQRNEIIWTRDLLEGGTPRNFNSGVTDPAFYSSPAFLSKPSCFGFFVNEASASADNAAAEAAGYTGVQDYNDYPAEAPPGPQPAYYDPNQPMGQWADWPLYRGLMDRAQKLAFTPAGLDVPSYWTNGNHDALMQGNEDGNAAFEDIATACFKALGTTVALPPSQPGPDFSPDPNLLLSPTAAGMLVPPDPLRRLVNRPQIKAIVGEHNVDNDHGFDFVPPAENTASNQNASYYAWNPPQTPGFRFINIDTNSEGGQTAEGVASGSANGNIDDPQFQWLKGELDAAQAAGKLIVIFGHHPVRSMTTEIADEQASPCTANDLDGDTPPHDVNPGCDLDPRPSEPIHLGSDAQAGDPRESFVELLDGYPNVLAYVAGHTHEHKLIPFTRPSDSSVWWEINTAATADWPQQHRLIDVMDNRDGSISIFGTVLDFADKAGPPPGCSGAGADPRCDQPGEAAAYSDRELGSIGRTFAYNDPQGGPPSGEGTPDDRNVEMILKDPRTNIPSANLSIAKADSVDPATQGQPLTYTLAAQNAGPDAAPEVTVTDHLPPNANFETASAGCVHSGTDVICSMGTLTSGQSAVATITVTPNAPGTMVNTALVDSAARDTAPANDADAETTQVNATPVPGGACSNRIVANSGDNTRIGTSQGDAMYGLAGDDILRGRRGADCLYGGRGNDRLYGDEGPDQLIGSSGADVIVGDTGQDSVMSGAGNDIVRVQGGSRDTVDCGSGRDYVKMSRNDKARRCERIIFR
jgi:uncharacterized repeat protein (TIGR01451 family)